MRWLLALTLFLAMSYLIERWSVSRIHHPDDPRHYKSCPTCIRIRGEYLDD